MNSKEILTSIKELVGLSKKEVTNEVEAIEEVILSTEVIAEEVIEEKIEEVELSTEEVIESVIEEVVELAEDKEEPKKEAAPVEAPVQSNFATQEELSQVKQELLSMIKTMMEDKSDYNEPDVPAKLSAESKESEELSEEVEEEVVHSPESVTEKRVQGYNNKGMTAAERVWSMINN